MVAPFTQPGQCRPVALLLVCITSEAAVEVVSVMNRRLHKQSEAAKLNDETGLRHFINMLCVCVIHYWELWRWWATVSRKLKEREEQLKMLLNYDDNKTSRSQVCYCKWLLLSCSSIVYKVLLTSLSCLKSEKKNYSGSYWFGSDLALGSGLFCLFLAHQIRMCVKRGWDWLDPGLCFWRFDQWPGIFQRVQSYHIREGAQLCPRLTLQFCFFFLLLLFSFI